MTPHEFISKWRNVELKERTASQSHFNDLCRLLQIEDPISADPKGEWFTFEKGATKTSGGEGWADVWRSGCFAWEYKGKAANLDKAFDQLLRYSIALESPPLLIVSDMARVRIHTNWTNTVQQVHEIAIEELADGKKRDLLRACFLDPERLRPSKTRQMITEDAAREFAGLAQRLHSRGHDPHVVAHFLNRLVFSMFAEDVGLLPGAMFTRMLEASRTNPAQFADHSGTLFAAMKTGGMVGFERVEWFNGGLFDDDTALPLESEDVDNLLKASRLDWSEIDPSILGTLFERGLDPAKRSQLGAHYTDRDKIMQIVRPVIVEPLEREWAAAKSQIEAAVDLAAGKTGAARTKAQATAARIMTDWRERLLRFRVLDPACGSGNFLYLSLLALKDIEHRANLEAEALGLPREFPRIGPENVLGIELNPYAAELARVSVWIGEIQWMRRNGFDASRNPILRTLGNIENRDAVLNQDGTKAVWPEADVLVGNPPFLGNKKMIRELGEDYTFKLRRAWPTLPGGVDLVCYWFANAWAMIINGKLQRAGLVATNSIRGGSNREVLKPIVEHGRILDAWSDEEWTVEGADVRVALVCFDHEPNGFKRLNGAQVEKIAADLSSAISPFDAGKISTLPQNAKRAFIGDQKSGPFNISGDHARALLRLPLNVNGKSNSDVVRPWANGSDLTDRSSDTWIIDFGPYLSEQEASYYEKPFEVVRRDVKPLRDGLRRANHRDKWWIHGEARPGMRRAIEGRPRFIASPRVAKHRFFVWLDSAVLPDSRLVALAFDDDVTFGILSSRFHEVWTLATCSWHGVGNDPTYNAESCFNTFPFPEGLTPNISPIAYAGDPRAVAIAAAAARLNELRENWLNPPDLVRSEPEVVPGYPDRILPIDDAAAKELAKRTLTNLYNARPQWLAKAHATLDEDVADAYGWGDDFRSGLLGDEEILARLFRINQERVGEQ
jgi:type II restriction/modification system DNA methylase subunit YeeA